MIGEVLAGNEQVGPGRVDDRNQGVPNILPAERPDVKGEIVRPAGVIKRRGLDAVAALVQAAQDLVADAPEAAWGHQVAEPQDFIGLLCLGIQIFHGSLAPSGRGHPARTYPVLLASRSGWRNNTRPPRFSGMAAPATRWAVPRQTISSCAPSALSVVNSMSAFCACPPARSRSFGRGAPKSVLAKSPVTVRST